MLNKKGITVSMITVIIIVLIILTTTVVISVNSSINNAKLRTFATELSMVTDEVKLRQNKGTDTSYMKEIFFLDVSNVSEEILSNQFAGEEITSNKITLYKIDLNELKIYNTVYGKNKTTADDYLETDIYAISTTTGKIYYCDGIKANNTTYYTLTDELRLMVNSTIESTNNSKQIIFKPSKIGWTNTPINVEIRVPNTYTNISVTTNLPGTNNDNVGAGQTVGGEIVIPVNISNIGSNYVITIVYTKDGTNVTETFEIKNFDDEGPVITKDGYTEKTTKDSYTVYEKVLVSDSLSGVKVKKYSPINYGTNNDSMIEYFKTDGTIFTGDMIEWKGLNQGYAYYAEDNAGNITYSTTFPAITTNSIIEGFDVVKGVNVPVILDGMAPVVCDSTSSTGDYWRNLKTGESVARSWYDYSAASKKWANARTEDGSLWVWIPRFEYKILETPGTLANTDKGTINIRFIPITTNSNTPGYTTNSAGIVTSSDGYIIHPAFVNETSYTYENGGWSEDLAGIWVSKFEMSMEENGVHKETTEAIGNSKVSSSIKMVSKSSRTAWRYINMASAYYNSLDYAKYVTAEETTLDATYDSHLIKNSEWGAVAYLANSEYGYGGEKVAPNSDASYYTGGENTLATVYSTNKNQTTTGNVYGIYDFAGGSFERVALFNASYTGEYIYDGSNPIYMTADGKTFGSYQGASTRYATAYENGESNIPTAQNSKIGDATYEVASTTQGKTWNDDVSNICTTGSPHIMRGGLHDTNGGFFTSITHTGVGVGTVSFRTILVKKPS